MEATSLPGLCEPVSSLTHLAGAVVCAVAAVPLLRRTSRRPGCRIFVSVFIVSTVLLLTLSGLYHLAPHGSASRELLLRLDHAAIFLLIAGTFTPPLGILFSGRTRATLMAGIWVPSLAAIYFKSVWFERFSSWEGLLLYLALGWAGLVPGWMAGRRYGVRFVQPLLIGAVIYTVGALVNGIQQPVLIPGIVGPHELFHFAVLAGLGYHWKFIETFAAGPPPTLDDGPFIRFPELPPGGKSGEIREPGRRRRSA